MSECNRLMLSFWDGGRCHFTRAMTLASEAQQRGMEVGFVTSEKYAYEIGSLAISNDIYVIPTRPPDTPTPPYEFPLYSHAFRHAQRLRGLGFDNSAWVRKVTDQEISAIKHFRPDVIVNDYRDTIRTSAQACGIPIVGITHTTGNTAGYTFGWWTDEPPAETLPDCRQSFNNIRTDFGLDPITDEREMFCGDVNIIPSTPSLDPLKERSPNSHYVGMISKWQPSTEQFELLSKDKYATRVFSYVGEPTRPTYGYESMLGQVIIENPTTGFYITGNPNRYANIDIVRRQQIGQVAIDSFLPGPEVIADSSVVLCHGGNGTVMLSLALGKPIICIGPYQSDCTSTFRGVELSGAGIMLNHSEGPLTSMPAPDLGENTRIYGYWSTELSSERINDAIESITSDISYAKNAQIIGEELVDLGGASAAINLINEAC